MAEGFIFYKSFTDALRDIPADQFKEVVLAVSDYATDGIMPEGLDLIGKAIFTLVKPQIDANNKRREDGAKGGRPRKETYGYETEKPVVSEVENHRFSDEKPKVKEKDKVKDKEKEEKEREKDPAVAIATLDAPAEVKQKMQGLADMRKKIKKPMTANAVNLMYKHLAELSPDVSTQCKILDQSIRNGWQDVYPLKTETKRASPNKFGTIIQHDYDFTELEKALIG